MVKYLPNIASSNEDFIRLSQAFISSDMIDDSVSEPANNYDNLSTHWYCLPFGLISQTLSLFWSNLYYDMPYSSDE